MLSAPLHMRTSNFFFFFFLPVLSDNDSSRQRYGRGTHGEGDADTLRMAPSVAVWPCTGAGSQPGSGAGLHSEPAALPRQTALRHGPVASL